MLVQIHFIVVYYARMAGLHEKMDAFLWELIVQFVGGEVTLFLPLFVLSLNSILNHKSAFFFICSLRVAKKRGGG